MKSTVQINLDDTIVAPASPPGPGGRAVVRLSGPDCRAIVSRCFTPNDAARWSTVRRAERHAGSVLLPDVAVPLPVEVWLWPGSRSYTAQPTAEFHLIGSPPLVEALTGELCRNGARPAKAGEFTLRAFLAGRVDLLQAEAVLGVIDATDEAQLSSALSQLGGGLSARIAAVHETLLIDLADLEAGLDFVEEDIDFVQRDAFRDRLAAASSTLTQLLQQADERLEARSKARVVLAGLPNAGKSTLFNRLAGRDVAIVSAERGTTRDWLRAEVEWDGCRLELVDTAGWDNAADFLSVAARSATGAACGAADLVVWCAAADFSPAEHEQSRRLLATCAESGRPVLTVITKADRGVPSALDADVRVSAHTGGGLDELRAAVARRIDWRGQHIGELLGSTAARCRASLLSARDALGRAAALIESGAGDELIAVELRAALESTGQVAGQSTTEDLLDRVFSRFCIGK